MRLAPCVIAAGLLALSGPARADGGEDTKGAKYFATIDRVDYEPTLLGVNRLVVWLSALELRGNVLPDIRPKLSVGGSALDDPHAFGGFAATTTETAVVFVIQATPEYAEALQALVPPLETEVIAKLPDKAQVAVIQYGDSVGSGKLDAAKKARSKLDAIAPDATPGDPALLDSVDRALGVLRKAKPSIEGAPMRKMIVIVSDGRDRSGDRDRVTRLGQRADKEGVRIHSFAYAPSKIRRPLLLLGELSKRSYGTFRFLFAGGTESWTPAFQQLADEIAKQYVLTYFVPADEDLAGKKVKVSISGRVETTSQNEGKVPALGCNGDPCAGYCTDDGCVVPAGPHERGVFGWIVLVVGILVGAVLVIGLVGFALSKRSKPIALPEGFVPPPGWVAPGSRAPGSKPPKAKPSKPPKNAPPPPVAQTGPSLLFAGGPRMGQRVYLRNGFVVGKAPGTDLQLEDGAVSGQHAQISIDAAGNVTLYDRNSTNGTYVNGVRVTEAQLYHGQSVRFGSTEMQYLAQ